MITRRDTIRLIAAASAASPLVFSISPEEAAAALDAPVPFDAGITPSATPIPSPTEFAEHLRHELWVDGFGWFHEGAPEEYARYRQALAVVSDVAPEQLSLQGINALSKLDEAVLNLCLAAWTAGVGVGAEVEHVRQAMVRPLQVCRSCHGDGRAGIGDRLFFPADAEAVADGLCRTCGGRGVVPSAAV